MGKYLHSMYNLQTECQEICLKEEIKEPKVSVIVPAWNVEEYIERCLSSLVQQTLKEIEIIVVDDGSTDSTSKIISCFEHCGSRIILINQEHKMQGAARNAGIKIAKGEYIGFVDADDWLDKDYFEKLYNAAKKYNSDIALATNIRTGHGKTKKRLNITKEEYLTDLQDKVDACHLWKDGCPTNKIYLADLLRKNEILFPEGVICEDKIFTTKAVYYANGIVTVPNIYYYYFRNLMSAVKINGRTSDKSRRNDKNNARLEVLNFLKSKNANIRDKDFWAVTKEIRFLGIPLYRIKESLHTKKHFLFSLIPVYENSEEINV